ncbi:hypothetical protein BCR44DRAFT_1484929 [Catenaria anguillulae PL171]|uniref:Uncharacterized protein n=1 Tax=Catenaria anguillulae PL171 TaxID=765915 RepID=A0A1Y2HMY6_9FUNG|nr:hypothetical protein BCR44DRAFT_1484929 [Catenaria anguillulae PL171]
MPIPRHVTWCCLAKPIDDTESIDLNPCNTRRALTSTPTRVRATACGTLAFKFVPSRQVRKTLNWTLNDITIERKVAPEAAAYKADIVKLNTLNGRGTEQEHRIHLFAVYLVRAVLTLPLFILHGIKSITRPALQHGQGQVIFRARFHHDISHVHAHLNRPPIRAHHCPARHCPAHQYRAHHFQACHCPARRCARDCRSVEAAQLDHDLTDEKAAHAATKGKLSRAAASHAHQVGLLEAKVRSQIKTEYNAAREAAQALEKELKSANGRIGSFDREAAAYRADILEFNAKYRTERERRIDLEGRLAKVEGSVTVDERARVDARVAELEKMLAEERKARAEAVACVLALTADADTASRRQSDASKRFANECRAPVTTKGSSCRAGEPDGI